jgi:urate oxidase
MPNGDLYDLYKDSPLKAGKNKGKTRFNFMACETFTALPNNPPRNLIIYIEDQIQNKSYFKKLEYLYSIYKKQKQST